MEPLSHDLRITGYESQGEIFEKAEPKLKLTIEQRLKLADLLRSSRAYDDSIPRELLDKITKCDEIGKLDYIKILNLACNSFVFQEQAAMVLAENFNRIGSASPEDYMPILQMLALKSSTAAESLAKNFVKYAPDSIEERLKLLQTLAASSANAARAFVRNFDKLGLEHASFQSRLELMQTIASQADTENDLAENLDKFVFTAPQERLELLQTLTQSNSSIALAFAKNCGKLGLESISSAERLEFLQALILQNEAAAEALAGNLDKLYLDDLSSEARVGVLKTIASQPGFSAMILAGNFDRLGLSSISPLQCFELLKTIATTNAYGAQGLTRNLDKLGLEVLPPAKRLELFKAIASGSYAAIALANIFDKLPLGGVSSKERIELLLAMALSSKFATEALVNNYHKLGLGALTKELRAQFLDVPAEHLLTIYPFLELVYEHDPEFRQNTIAKLETALNAPDIDPWAQYALGSQIYEKQALLGLESEHPLIQVILHLGAVAQYPGEKNAYSLYSKLQQLAKEASTYSPPKMESDGVQVGINMQQLQSMASTIERDELPKNVSLEAYTEFLKHLKAKVTAGEKSAIPAAEAALNNLGTKWDEVSSYEVDPENTLLNLLAKTEGFVSESEAKWRAVLSGIFAQSQAPRGEFFTEQEEFFIKTMMGIQHCEGGKKYGIAFAYEQLDPQYRYKVPLPKPLTPEESKAEQQRNEALAGIAAFLKEMPKDTDPVTFLSESSKMEKWTRELTGWASILFASDPKLDAYIVADKDALAFEISPAGAEEIMAMLLKDATEAPVAPLVAQSVHKMLAAQFTGDNLLMKELAEVEDVEQVLHQEIYLKNLIGPLLGITHAISFDKYTHVLSDALIAKSRDAVLELFFKHFTPKVMANALAADLNKATPEQKASLKRLLPDLYWQDPLTINRQGAVALLRRFKYLL